MIAVSAGSEYSRVVSSDEEMEMGQREMVQASLNAEHDHGVYGRRKAQRRQLVGRRDEDAWYPTKAEGHVFVSPTVLPGPVTVRTNHGDVVPLPEADQRTAGAVTVDKVTPMRNLITGEVAESDTGQLFGVSSNRQGWKPRLHHVEMLLARNLDDPDLIDWANRDEIAQALAELRSILDGE